MKKILLVLLVMAFFMSACGGASDAEPTPIPVNTAVPTAVIEENTAGDSVDTDAEAGTERVTPADGMTQVFVPAGSFQMGGLDSKNQPDELPPHKVTISAFWMDKLEVTNAMYKLCVDEGACDLPSTFASEKHEQYFNTDQFADFPVVNVSWGNANDYCTWAGKRLPTEAEWEYAARGTDLRTFPWGDERPDGSQANFNRNINDVTRVGSFPTGASPFGVLDMAGNVWEWVADYYGPEAYAQALSANPTGPLAAVGSSERRVIRGGSYQDLEADIRVANRGYASGPDLEADLGSAEYLGETSSKIGFRCAADN